MELICENCQTSYTVSATHTGYRFYCHVCRAPLLIPTAPTGGTSALIQVVCSHCSRAFSVENDAEADVQACPHCGKSINIGSDGATLVMQPVHASLVSDAAPDSNFSLSGSSVIAEAADSVAEMTNENTVGGYRIIREDRQTDLGTIFIAEQTALKRGVEYYRLHGNIADNVTRREAFLTEARKAAALIHPNIVQVYDISTSQGFAVVSQLVLEDSLATRIANGAVLPPEEVMRIGLQAAEALSHAHLHDLLHRALTPEAIVFDKRQNILLRHFGISLALFMGQSSDRLRKMYALSPYIAPEQLQALEVDATADIYALGIILAQALTGRPPYTPADMIAFLDGAEDPPHLDPSLLPDETSPAFVDLLERMISLNASLRPASAAQVVDAMRHLVRPRSTSSRFLKKKSSESQELPPAARRKYRRIRTEMDVSVEPIDVSSEQRAEYMTRVENLSENGAFVLTSTPLPMGTFVKLAFRLEGGNTRVAVLGIVRWRDLSPGNVGMGVQFLEVSTSDKKDLRSYVSTHAAMDVIQQLTVSALHKKLLRTVCLNWNQEIPVEELSRGCGAGKNLFDRVLADFVRCGIVEVRDTTARILRPRNEDTVTELERAASLRR